MKPRFTRVLHTSQPIILFQDNTINSPFTAVEGCDCKSSVLDEMIKFSTMLNLDSHIVIPLAKSTNWGKLDAGEHTAEVINKAMCESNFITSIGLDSEMQCNTSRVVGYIVVNADQFVSISKQSLHDFCNAYRKKDGDIQILS